MIDSASPSPLLFILTTAVLCTWFGVVVGTYLKNYQENNDKLENTQLNENPKSLDHDCDSFSIIRDKPRHIAVIMDGNRRFGRKFHGDAIQGHYQGGQKLLDFIQWCQNEGIHYLTVFAFSTENWSRDPVEVSALMATFVQHSLSLKTEAVKRNIFVKVLSTSNDRLPVNVLESINELEEATKNCTGFSLNVCFSYGAKEEISIACKSIAEDVLNGKIQISNIDSSILSNYMLTRNIPDPDLVIRTSGENRISNFLLWQIAYSELFFISKHWPEITKEDLQLIIEQYRRRDRRFGK